MSSSRESGCAYRGLPAHGEQGFCALQAPQEVDYPRETMPSSVRERVAGRPKYGTVKNSLTAYHAHGGGKLRHWEAGMEKRPEFRDRLTLLHSSVGMPKAGESCLLSGDGEVRTGRALDRRPQSFAVDLRLLGPRPGLAQRTLPSTWFT